MHNKSIKILILCLKFAFIFKIDFNLEFNIGVLVDVSPFVSSELQIWNCSITAETLNKIVVHFCHIKKLWICWSWFNFEKDDELDFMMAYDPQLKEISFEGCGDEVLTNWGECTDSFKAIMKGFMNSAIRDKIRLVHCDYCNIEDSELDKIMIESKISCYK